MDLAIEQLDIVLLGTFNPAIFHPNWLLKHELIAQEDGAIDPKIQPPIAGQEKVSVWAPDMAAFSVGEFIRLEVNQERFVVTTIRPDRQEQARDFVIGCFDILKHTPIKAMGVNFTRQYKISKSQKDSIFHSVFNMKNLANIHTGVDPLAMTLVYPRPDSYRGLIRLDIQSNKTDDKNVVVQIRMNNHFDFIVGKDALLNAVPAMEMLEGDWGLAVNRIRDVCATLLGGDRA